VVALTDLAAAGHTVALVITRPDRRRGRGSALVQSPVKAAAGALGLPVSSRLEDVLDVDAELGVVVAYGRLVPAPVLAALPMVNVHFSLLPRWRGAAPVERAILAGDQETGVCLMALEEELDTGGIYDCKRVEIGPDETADELRARLASLGAELLVSHLVDGPASLGQARPQVGEATWATKVDRSVLHLDWSRPATELARVVRLGRAWTSAGGHRLLIQRARAHDPAPVPGPPGSLQGAMVATGQGGLELLVVQPEGRAPMDAQAWRRGARLADGTVLG
jgi:methionyl-tRNA formyltransferase